MTNARNNTTAATFNRPPQRHHNGVQLGPQANDQGEDEYETQTGGGQEASGDDGGQADHQAQAAQAGQEGYDVRTAPLQRHSPFQADQSAQETADHQRAVLSHARS